MKRQFYFIMICVIMFTQCHAQIEDQVSIANAKLLSFNLERIANSKYKYKTVFTFQNEKQEIIKINIPCDPSMNGTLVFGNYQCMLQIDSVYQIQLQKITLSSIPEDIKNTQGFFYTKKYVEQIGNSSRIELRSNVKESEEDNVQILSDYVDSDGFLYKIINLSPDKCSRLRN